MVVARLGWFTLNPKGLVFVRLAVLVKRFWCMYKIRKLKHTYPPVLSRKSVPQNTPSQINLPSCGLYSMCRVQGVDVCKLLVLETALGFST